jgi:hypothetical protein
MSMLVFASGCSSNQKTSSVKSADDQREFILKELDSIYYKYAKGDVNQARLSLLHGVNLLEKASCFKEDDQAGLLSLEYSRLAVLESKAGDNSASQAFLLSAQYWQLKNFELSNNSPGEAMEKVKAFNIHEITSFVERMDKTILNGKFAEYNYAKMNTDPTNKP